MNFQPYYKLPLQLGKVINKKQHDVCKIEDSIAQNIHLILVTQFEECRYDSTYGCCVWEYDFELLPQVGNWKTSIATNILDTLNKHEKRLVNADVRVAIDQQEFISQLDKNIKRVKKRIGITIKGNLKYTNERFEYYEAIYFSPISLD